ncbi:MAG: MFS transporter [Burkholderiaceae bacterium]
MPSLLSATPSIAQSQSAALRSACGAHIVQDGLVALQYVLLPVLAQAMGLNYGQVGLLRAVSSTALSVLEIPAGLLAERTGERRLLVVGLLAAGAGYIGVASASGFIGIALCFLLAGAGAAFQHSLSSAIVVSQFSGDNRRLALGRYNSAGDLGKLLFTGSFSFAVGAGLAWQVVVVGLACVAIGFALIVGLVFRPANSALETDADDTLDTSGSVRSNPSDQSGTVNATSIPCAAATVPAGLAKRWGVQRPRGFIVLGAVVYLDSTVQSVFLTFLAFVLLSKGASASIAATGVTIALAGGMAGKLIGGTLAARLGDRRAFRLIQVLTIIALMALLVLPLSAVLLLLPLTGLVVQGSSTVSYGSVADYLDVGRSSRGYSLIYTLAGFSSITGPLMAGVLADWFGLSAALLLAVGLITLTLPLARVMSSGLAR